MSPHDDDQEESNGVVPEDIELPLSPPPQTRPAPLKIPKPSRLPIPRKVSSPLPSPTTPGLRSQPSRDRLGSHGDGKNIQDSMHHTISRRPSKLRLVEGVDPEDAQGDDGGMILCLSCCFCVYQRLRKGCSKSAAAPHLILYQH
jgi:hypothetical protein